jgi:hypothetical protein
MDFLGILELVIGLVFIYFILGLMSTVVREIFNNFLNYRAKHLEAWLKDTFSEELGSKILKHKLIDGLTAKKRRASFYPTKVFINTLLDQINSEKDKDGDNKPYTIDSIKKKINESDLLPADFKRTLLQSISESRGDLKRFKNDVGNWFDQAMVRISGTYKKHTQKALILISFIIVVAVNADTIELSKYFHDNPVQRKAMVEQIDRMVKEGELEELYQDIIHENDTVQNTAVIPIDSLKAEIQTFHELNEELSSYNLPLGWQKVTIGMGVLNHQNPGWILSKICGLLLTTLAVSIGAPFWYDVLNKLVNLRSSGALPRTKPLSK